MSDAFETGRQAGLLEAAKLAREFGARWDKEGPHRTLYWVTRVVSALMIAAAIEAWAAKSSPKRTQ